MNDPDSTTTEVPPRPLTSTSNKVVTNTNNTNNVLSLPSPPSSLQHQLPPTITKTASPVTASMMIGGSSGTVATTSATSGASSSLLHEREVVREAGRLAISSFLDKAACFEILRASGKVVVFDTRIPIQLAFYALVEHDMQAAPLWDRQIRQFVGLLTVTDFIDILRHHRSEQSTVPASVSSLSTRSIAQILADPVLRKHVKHGGKFLAADATTSLKHACALLHSNDLDFLPVMLPDDVRVLATVTYTNVLEHLVAHFREQRRLFDDSVFDLGIGTYQDIVTATPEDTLTETLDKLARHDLSAVPIVDASTQKVLDVYSRSDITFLASAMDAEDAVSNLNKTLGDMTVRMASAVERTGTRANLVESVSTPDRLHTCSKHHTLQSIFEYFAQLKFNRLIVTDEEGRCVGVVSARDLVKYFLVGGKGREDDLI